MYIQYYGIVNYINHCELAEFSFCQPIKSLNEVTLSFVVFFHSSMCAWWRSFQFIVLLQWIEKFIYFMRIEKWTLGFFSLAHITNCIIRGYGMKWNQKARNIVKFNSTIVRLKIYINRRWRTYMSQLFNLIKSSNGRGKQLKADSKSANLFKLDYMKRVSSFVKLLR